MALEDPTKSTLFSSLLILLSYFLVKVSCDFTADVSKQMKSAEVDQLRHLCFRIVSRYLLEPTTHGQACRTRSITYDGMIPLNPALVKI